MRFPLKSQELYIVLDVLNVKGRTDLEALGTFSSNFQKRLKIQNSTETNT